MLGDLVPTLFVLALVALAAAMVRTRYSGREYQLVLASLGAHLVSAVGMLWMVYSVYAKGDIMMYHSTGTQISRLLRMDPMGVGWEVLKMLLQMESNLGFVGISAAPSTGTLLAVTGILQLFLADSLIAVSLLLAAVSWLGKLAMFEGLVDLFGERQLRERLLIAAMLVPSVVFWSGGIIKEGVAIAGMGLFILALGRLRRRLTPRAVVLGALGALIVALLKPHNLVGLAVGLGAWVYWHRSTDAKGRVRIRPIPLVVGIGLTVVLLAVIGELFPKLSVENIADEAADMQFYGSRTQGGSRYSIGDPTSRSLLGQAAFLPLALFTGLFRPLPFEARNPQMMMNALETTLMLGLVAQILWKQSLPGLWRQLSRRPALVMLFVTSLVLAAGVGLVSNTLGTLSRYRMSVMPFFVAFVLVVGAPPARAATVRKKARGPWMRPIDRERAALGAASQGG